MSSPSFGSLYYTDCLPGQGLRGGAGFQFQAVSRDVTHDMMALTQRSALYEAPVGWMREHRSVEEYPPSLTHVFDGCYVTARGVYLGAEANGVREGNQFTHAVATEDAEAYGMVRPAQLWDAPWWSERPAPSTECEPVGAEPEIGTWGIDAVREWVLGQPDGEEWLTAVHSTVDRVHDEDRRRLLFVSADPAPVLCWLAAATLLLPQTRAVRVSFRVFATNPHYSEHDVLALHPDWAGQFTGGGTEFVVFNLHDGTHSPVEPTESATQWVPRFLRGDPFDVVDAIELADQLAGPDAAASTSDTLASRAVLLGEPASDARECALLTTWLAGRAGMGGEDVVVPVANAVLAGQPGLPVLRELDGAVRRQADELRVRVRRALFDAEVNALLADPLPEPRTETLPPVAWSLAEDAMMLVEGVANRVAPPRLPRLLRIAAQFGVTPREGAFRDGIHRFAQWWADNPKEPVALDGLPSEPTLIGQLRGVLAQRLRVADRRPAEKAVYNHLWRVLYPTVTDPTAPLDQIVAAATIWRGNAGLRATMRKAVMDRILTMMPADVVTTAWAAMFQYDLPDIEELAWFLTVLPPGRISRSLAGHAYEVIDKASRTRIHSDTLDALDQLRTRGATPPPGRLANLTKESHALRRWSSSIGATRQTKEAQAVADLRTVSATVLLVRADEVLDALLAGTTLGNAAHAAELGNHDLRALLATRLPAVWADQKLADRRRDAAVALAYLTATAHTCTRDTSARLVLALRKWATDNETKHQRVGKLLEEIDPEHAGQWKKDLLPGSGTLGPDKVSTPRPTKVDDRAREKAKPKDDKDEKRPRWRLGHRRGRE